MKKIKKIIISILTVLLLSSCNSSKTYVAYSIYPIGFLLEKIGGNRINAISIQTDELVQICQIKENYEEILKDSSIFFHIGSLEPYMDLYDDEIKETDVEINDLSILNTFYKYKRYTPIVVNGTLNFVESEYYEGDSFLDIDMYDYDPFIWLSPIGMLSMANDIKTYLASNYVEQSAYFIENYNNLADELITIDANYQNLARRLVKENKCIKFASMTGSFGIWQKDYGFEVYPICLSKYGALPSESELEIIKKAIKDNNVNYIVYEPNMSEKMLELFTEIEEELGLKRVYLSNISSLSKSQSESNKDYLSIMKENLSVLESIVQSKVAGE